MLNNITCKIEKISIEELIAEMRFQADDAFPDLKEEQRIKMLSEKWIMNAEFCTCRKNNSLIGIIVFYANQPERGVAYIPHVYVSKEYRRQGLFSLMLNHVKIYVRSKGFITISLEVNNKNIEAQQSYIRNGFSFEQKASKKSMFMECRL